MVVHPLVGSSYAVVVVTIGTSSKFSWYDEKAETLAVRSVYSSITQLGPATQVSACESSSQVR